MTALEEIYEFEIGAKVLAYYRGLLYEATCINRRFSDEGVIQYYVHYKGFKKKWDEWTDYDEVLAINKTNLAHKNNLESLRKACRSKRVKKSQKPKKTHYASSAKPEKRKRGRPKKNVTQSAGPASKKCLEQAIAKCIEPVKGKSSELATATYIEPVKGKSSELATATYIEPAAAKFVETGSTNFAIPASAEIRQLSVKVIDILKYGNKTQFVESAIAQFAEPIIEKSADSAISTFEEPTTTQFIGLPTAQFAELAVDDSAIHVEPDSVQITEPAPAQFSGPDVEKFAESAILTFEEPTTTQFAGLVPTQFAELVVKETKIQIFTEPDSTQFAVPATSQFSEGAIEKSAESALLTFEEPATIQFAALVPTQFPELTVKKSDLEIIAEPHTTQTAGPATDGCVEAAVEKSTESPIQIFAGPSTSRCAESSVENSAESVMHTVSEPAVTSKRVKKSQDPWTTEDDSSSTPANKKRCTPKKNVEQAAGPATSQFSEVAIEKSAESALLTFEEPATIQFAALVPTQFPELTVKKSDLEIFAEPHTTQTAGPATDECVEAAVEKSTESPIQIFAGTSKSQCEESAVENSAESVMHTVSEPAVTSKRVKKSQEPWTTEDASSSTPANKKRCTPKKNVEQAAGPATSQFSEVAIEKSAESALLTFEEPATIQFAALVPTQFPELTVKKSDLEIFAEPHTTQTAGPATDECVEAAVEKSTESPIQIFAGPSTSRCAESSVENSAESVMHTFSIPAVTSKRVKKSQEPWTTEDDSSSTPANKKRCTPKKNVEQAAGPSTSQLAEPAIEKSVESAIQTFVEPAVGVSAIPVVEQSIQTEEGEEAVRAVENVVIDIIPRSKHIAIELFKEIKLPLNLQNALDYDRIMHFRYQKVLKFGVEKSLAEIIYAFANSPYFIDDDQKKNSTMFCLTLMKYFNYCVHKRLTYLPEKKFGLRKKAVHYFTKRINAKPTFNFKFKSQLIPKSIWCYLYGPMYLVRLIADLPKMLLSNLWFPDYDLETFVHQIKCLIRFLEDNLNTYFSNNDYIDTET